MNAYLLVFIGGGIGSVLRFIVSKWLNPITAVLPLGTLTANLISSFVLGFTIAFVQVKYPDNAILQPFIVAGICGGFSTFSGFSYENILLIKSGDYTLAMLNILLNVILCIIFIALGMKLGSSISN